MSAILDRRAQSQHSGSNSDLCPDESWYYHLDTLRPQPDVELERLRDTLVAYDPHDHVTDFANSGPEYGPILGKFLVYLFLAAIPAAGAALFLAPVFGC
jgi:hypothetical protein